MAKSLRDRAIEENAHYDAIAENALRDKSKLIKNILSGKIIISRENIKAKS